jgi:hypothetical protein
LNNKIREREREEEEGERKRRGREKKRKKNCLSIDSFCFLLGKYSSSFFMKFSFLLFGMLVL